MKKFQISGLAFVVMFALYAVIVATASAETTLPAFWLFNGSAITTELAVEGTSEVKLEDTKTLVGNIAVLCSGILVGTVGPEGKGLITEELNLELELISGTTLVGLALLCETTTGCETDAKSPIEDWPENLPWPTLLFLAENGEILGLVEHGGTDVLCLVVGIMTEDLCEASDTTGPVINEPTAEIPSGSIGLPLGTCTEGGVGSGVIESTSLGTISLVEGGTLTVSSE